LANSDVEEDTPADGGFRAFAFTGSFDAVVQLGVIHALLVSSGRAPDAVVGLSGGAVNAAALAEILQAGDAQAQVDKLRKFLDSYLRIPGELARSIFPDAFEINANEPLKPLELPIHFKEEREDRNQASRARWGLIYAMNKLFGLRLTVRDLALIANRFLGIVAATDCPRLPRYWHRTRHIVILWWKSLTFGVLAPLFWSLLIAAILGSNTRQRGSTAGQLLWRPTRLFRRAFKALGILSLAVAWFLLGLAPILGLLSLVVCLFYQVGWLSAWNPSSGWILSFWIIVIGFILWFIGLLFIILTFFVPPLMRLRRAALRGLLDRTLENLALNDGLSDSYVLKQQLVDCFDHEYYGKIEIDEVLKRASNGVPDAIPSNPKRPKKVLKDYQRTKPFIQVGVVAAEVKTGDLLAFSGDVPVVDALLAATAHVPYFPAVEVATGQQKRYFIDGGNISREAVGPLLNLLREEERLDHVAYVDVYPVHLLLRNGGGASGDADSNLIQVALRGLQLQQMRDATIEQRLTGLYSKALPNEKARIRIAGRTFLRTRIFPLDVDPGESFERGVSRRTGNDLRATLYEGIAAGCRAALEGMIPGAIAGTATRLSTQQTPLTVPCREAIITRLGQSNKLPGASRSPGPGLSEICKHCTLKQSTGEALQQHLRVPTGKCREERPEWPVHSNGQGAPSRPEAGAPAEAMEYGGVIEETATGLSSPQGDTETVWPLPRRECAGNSRPVVSFLFGGGVFRGVFHMGVLNALNELEVVPDLVAGSSVGSIIAAMIAQVFTLESPKGRRGQIARLAATFLGIDRLVLSDRMADFVRGLTVRAGDARFSPRDLDLALRRYDFDGSASFSRRLRQVAAGLERLLYLSPVDFFRLIETGRSRRFGELREQLEATVQRFLDRSGVNQEILGSEPLALLIRSHVIEQLAAQGSPEGLFSSFIDKGVFFLATTTNLTQGKLEILGLRENAHDVLLLEGLLASSAFPAIFRPREAWEVFRTASAQDRYFDGGIMDNLPLDAVAEFLHESRDIERRPRFNGQPVPHLLFTASLEVDKQALPNDRVEVVSRSFLRLRKRASSFTYNRKLDSYGHVQDDLRTIYEARVGNGEKPWAPLDLHVAAVKPQWLCDTFGFHPMLGFRRHKQAQSIAHGCASTLAQLYAERARHPAWTDGWGVRGLDRIDPHSVLVGGEQTTLIPQRKHKAAGECWFRTGVFCPFSPKSLAELTLEEGTARQVGQIYEVCGKVQTHRSM
jgi:predicted acylesterase/phospholipase RssA